MARRPRWCGARACFPRRSERVHSRGPVRTVSPRDGSRRASPRAKPHQAGESDRRASDELHETGSRAGPSIRTGIRTRGGKNARKPPRVAAAWIATNHLFAGTFPLPTRTNDTMISERCVRTLDRVPPVSRESSIHAGFRHLRWRDPDSNRGHHDFQSCGLGWPEARNPWKPSGSPLTRAPSRSPLFTSCCTQFRRWRRLISFFRRRLER
jgi:hypothetical protein